MWVNKQLFQTILDDNKDMQVRLSGERIDNAKLSMIVTEARTQKAKDDITIDWMRHRINALEKQNAILLQKAAGVTVPVPEIVPTRPGTIAGEGLDMQTMPSFEDVGDAEAERLGIKHDEEGVLVFTK